VIWRRPWGCRVSALQIVAISQGSALAILAAFDLLAPISLETPRGTRDALGWLMDRPELERRSAQFARDAFTICQMVRRRQAGGRPADQLQKAASSIAANYRACARARTPKEFVAKIGIVSEEADEAVFWLEYIRNTKLAPDTSVMPLQDEARQLRAIFAASYATARRNLANR
jgi:four helix bundle protein